MLRTLLLTSTLSISLLAPAAQAQSAASVAGTVTDAFTQAPVPFAALAVPGQPGGAVANGEGRFQLAVPAGADSVRVQALGYLPRTVAVKNSSGALAVPLQPQPFALQEVTVTALAPATLLKRAVRQTTARLASPLGLHAYYREFTTYNGQVAKFADALVDYYLESKPRRPRSPLVQTRVLESRAGQSALSKKEEAQAIPVPMGVDNAGRYYSVLYQSPFLDSARFKFYAYTVLETPAGAADAPYYEVRCTPTTHEPEYLTQGLVRIDRRTLVIQHVESEVPPALQPYLVSISLFGVRVQLTQLRQRADYQEYNGRLYPSFVRFELLVDMTKSAVLTHYAFTNDMLVRGLQASPQPIPKDEQYTRPLYLRGTLYTRPYWREGSVVPATAAEEAAINTLETSGPGQ